MSKKNSPHSVKKSQARKKKLITRHQRPHTHPLSLKNQGRGVESIQRELARSLFNSTVMMRLMELRTTRAQRNDPNYTVDLGDDYWNILTHLYTRRETSSCEQTNTLFVQHFLDGLHLYRELTQHFFTDYHQRLDPAVIILAIGNIIIGFRNLVKKTHYSSQNPISNQDLTTQWITILTQAVDTTYQQCCYMHNDTLNHLLPQVAKTDHAIAHECIYFDHETSKVITDIPLVAKQVGDIYPTIRQLSIEQSEFLKHFATNMIDRDIPTESYNHELRK